MKKEMLNSHLQTKKGKKSSALKAICLLHHNFQVTSPLHTV